MKKIKILLLTILIGVSTNLFSQELKSTKDTIYVNDIPIGMIDTIVTFPYHTFIKVISFKLVDDIFLKKQAILKYEFTITVVNIIEYVDINNTKYNLDKLREYSYKQPIIIDSLLNIKNINISKVDNKLVDLENASIELRQNLKAAGTLYDIRNTLAILGTATSVAFIQNENVQIGVAISSITTMLSIILDYKGNQYLKANTQNY